MPPIKSSPGYPPDGSPASGRALSQIQQTREEEQMPNDYPDEQTQADMNADNPPGPGLAAQATPQPSDQGGTAEVDLEVNEANSEAGPPPQRLSVPDEPTISPQSTILVAPASLPLPEIQASTLQPALEASSALPGLAAPELLPPQTADMVPTHGNRAKGNSNTKGHYGRFLTKVWYAYPDARLMNGNAWTEEADLLHWYLHSVQGLTQKAASRYLHPFDKGACQNRWQRMKGVYSELRGEELTAALAERDRLGMLWSQGYFDYRIPLSEEAQRVKEANRRAKRVVVPKWKRGGQAAAEPERKGKEKEATKEGDREGDDGGDDE